MYVSKHLPWWWVKEHVKPTRHKGIFFPFWGSRKLVIYPLDGPLDFLRACIHRQGPYVSCPCNIRSRKPSSCDEHWSNVEPAKCNKNILLQFSNARTEDKIQLNWLPLLKTLYSLERRFLNASWQQLDFGSPNILGRQNRNLLALFLLWS